MYKYLLGKLPLSLKHLLQNLETLMPITPEIWKPFWYLDTKLKMYMKVYHADPQIRLDFLCALHTLQFSSSLFQIQVICLLHQGLDANQFWVLCDSICGHKGAKRGFLVGTLETWVMNGFTPNMHLRRQLIFGTLQFHLWPPGSHCKPHSFQLIYCKFTPYIQHSTVPFLATRRPTLVFTVCTLQSRVFS